MRTLHGLGRIADEFETAATVLVVPGSATGPLEDEDTKPGWIRPRRVLPLSPRDQKHLRDAVAYVGTVAQGQRPGAVARALRNVLRHFANPPDLRESAMAFLADEAVRFDGQDGPK